MVSPMMIGQDHPLYNVSGVFNAIFVRGNMLGDAMFYGRGAGKLPTASAVVADVVEEVRHMNTNIRLTWNPEKLHLADMKEASHRFFVRVSGSVSDKGEQVSRIFGNVSFVQAVDGEFGFVTESMEEKVFDEKAAQIDGVLMRIRGNF